MAWTSPQWLKIASAVLTWPSNIRDPLLRAHAQTGLPLVMSTGMCDAVQIDEALDVLCSTWATEPASAFTSPGLVLLACTSTYPCEDHEINLRTIPAIRERWDWPTGYSGHERGIATTVAAVALGACFVERHITLDRSSYGSDQAASLEPPGFARMVRDIRSVEKALGSAEKVCLPSEQGVKQKLMRRAG
jgi:N-acetylneuraminate synthase